MDANVLISGLIKNFFEDNQIKSFEDKLLLNNSKMKNLMKFLEVSILFGTVFMIIGMILVNYFFKLNEKIIIVGIFCFFIPFIINYIFQDLKFEKNKRKKEELLTDVLLEASVIVDELSTIKLIENLANKDDEEFRLISENFSRIYFEINNGGEIKIAIKNEIRRNKSQIFNKFGELLIQKYESGIKMNEMFKELAEDIIENRTILKERQATMLVTKYTLILSAGLIVPSVLGLIVGLITNLNFGGISQIEIGLSEIARKEILELSVLGTYIYLIEYALLSSFFLGIYNSNKKFAIVYGSILIPVSLIVFVISQQLY
ncbi:MAG: type II secretion system F family protein [Candidatus ainarchaeum sp.]|nr:type II secretion system F family protein [Candidatus ainarchaeum sp.]